MLVAGGQQAGLQTAHARVLARHVLDGLQALETASIDCVVTSPPYWGLRAYGTAGQVWGGAADCAHVWGAPAEIERTSPPGSEKQASNRGANGVTGSSSDCTVCGAWLGELGMEPSPELYVAHIVDVFREIRRVLRPHGVVWLNIGDSYAMKNGQGGDPDPMFTPTRGKRLPRGSGRWSNTGVRRTGRNDRDRETPGGRGGSFRGGERREFYVNAPGLKPKDLVGIPWRVAFALQADGWWLRSEIIWSKPNPMPESVVDRPTKSHEQLFLLAASGRYYYDQEPIREAYASGPSDMRKMIEQRERIGGKTLVNDDPLYAANGTTNIGRKRGVGDADAGGRNARSVWEIATEPYEGAHFATFPTELPRRCILAGTSEAGICPQCGRPWRREIERGNSEHHCAPMCPQHPNGTGATKWIGYGGWYGTARASAEWRRSCDHALEPVPAVVLDPFAGSGTTLAVAVELGRDAVGVELQPEYLGLIQRRVAAAELARSRRDVDGPLRAETVQDLGPLWENVK